MVWPDSYSFAFFPASAVANTPADWELRRRNVSLLYVRENSTQVLRGGIARIPTTPRGAAPCFSRSRVGPVTLCYVALFYLSRRRSVCTILNRHFPRVADTLRLSTMGFGFDIFRRLDDGNPLWVAQADTLEEARRRLDAIRRISPGTYFVRDASTGEPVASDLEE
jgi:hypothetical protein